MTKPYPYRDLAKLEGAMLSTYKRELGMNLVDPKRLQEVYGLSFWNAEHQVKLAGVCQTAVMIMEVSASEVVLLTGDQRVHIAGHGPGIEVFGGTSAMTIDANDSWCQHVVGVKGPLVVNDSRAHTLVCDTVLSVDGRLRAYLGVPLITRNQQVVGSLCVWDFEPKDWTEQHVAMLTSLAAVIMRFEEIH